MKPFGDTPETEVYDWLSEQSRTLVEGGADAILLETMTTVEEMRVAIRAARNAGAPTVIASMSFNSVDGEYMTMKGVSIKSGVEAMSDADMIGCNCGADVVSTDYVAIAGRIRARSAKPMMIKMNAGKPELIDRQVVYKQTPEMMARVINDLIRSGANIIGGCCGTTPENIREFANTLNSKNC
jgi:5-methyltetrahydrofolate--homocysteine methyltransferase